MSAATDRQGVGACCTLSSMLGTIHAFSVFVPEWEIALSADRASVSLVYSLALVSITVSVLFGYLLFSLVSPFAIFILVGVVGSSGLMLSAFADSLQSLYLAYGVVFGLANGLGYAYVLQLAGQIMSERRALVMSFVTAFYAVGATISPLLFAYFIGIGGNSLAMLVMSVILLFAAIACALIVKRSISEFESSDVDDGTVRSTTQKKIRLGLWAGYGCAVTGGLMVIGHAYAIAIWLSLDARQATWATTVVAFGNMSGGFTAGFIADRFSGSLMIRGLPLLSILAILVLLSTAHASTPGATEGNVHAVLFGLGLVGFSYGAIIAVYPVVVSDIFGSLAAPKVYGQIFTAWGLAGLCGPLISGWLFDLTNAYSLALWMVMILSLASVLVIRFVMRP